MSYPRDRASPRCGRQVHAVAGILSRCLPVLLSTVLLLGCRGPKTMRVEISVSGMTCESCVEAITHELGRLEGVQSVSVDLEAGKATVVYDAGEIAPAELEQAIEGIGYDAELGEIANAPASPKSD